MPKTLDVVRDTMRTHTACFGGMARFKPLKEHYFVVLNVNL